MLVFVAAWVALLAILGTFNFVLDPFLAYRMVVIEALRPYRDKLVSPIAKAEILDHENCQVVILGTSRAQMALDPDSPAWGAPTCNLALTAASLPELLGVFERAVREPGVREIVLTIDLQAGPGDAPLREEYLRSRFSDQLPAIEYQGGLLFGEDATRASLLLVSDFLRGRLSPYSERGFTNPTLRGRFADRERFMRTLAQTIEAVRAPPHERASETAPLFARIAADIRAAHARAIAVTVVVLPSHALFLETAQRFGKWPAIEREREAFLRAIVDEGGEPIAPVFDFTSYAGAAAEPVPPVGSATDMRWHWDAVHVKPEIGEEVIAQIRRGERPRNVRPGVLLELDTLEVERERLRGEREYFLRVHGAELALIDEATAGRRP